VPVTAHAAFDKAAGYFGIKILHAPVDEITRKVNVKAVRRLVNSNTVMVCNPLFGFLPLSPPLSSPPLPLSPSLLLLSFSQFPPFHLFFFFPLFLSRSLAPLPPSPMESSTTSRLLARLPPSTMSASMWTAVLVASSSPLWRRLGGCHFSPPFLSQIAFLSLSFFFLFLFLFPEPVSPSPPLTSASRV